MGREQGAPQAYYASQVGALGMQASSDLRAINTMQVKC
jgi:hypothetical protein